MCTVARGGILGIVGRTTWVQRRDAQSPDRVREQADHSTERSDDRLRTEPADRLAPVLADTDCENLKGISAQSASANAVGARCHPPSTTFHDRIRQDVTNPSRT